MWHKSMLLAEDRIDTAFYPSGPGSQSGMIHNDHLATPQKMTDSSGTVVWAADYKPFGEATITVSTITNNLRFPGQYYDAETGLNYNYFRDYNPVIGRYVQADPIGLTGGINLYRYVGNHPVKRVDPFGLKEICGPWFSEKTEWQYHPLTTEWKHRGTTVLIEGLSGACHWAKVEEGYRTRRILPRQLCFDTCNKSKGLYFKYGDSIEESENYEKTIDVAVTGIRWFPDGTSHRWILICDPNDIKLIYGK